MPLDLDHRWTVRAVGGEVPASVAGATFPAAVPGCIHLDLLAAGVVPDPYLDDQEREQAWIGFVDWRYETTFHWDTASHPGEQTELVAEGLDTFATVELNGHVLGTTANMHRTHRFDLAGLLVEGDNALAVTFAAGVPATRRASEELGPLPHINTHPFNAARKMASNYGWDWGPDLVTAGIWRPIRIESWSDARIASVRPLVGVVGDDGILRAHVDLSGELRSADTALAVTVTVAGQTVRVDAAPGATGVVAQVTVPSVDRWWPRGYGEQPLYDVLVTLEARGEICDEWRGRVGFRTVALDTTPDADGTPFRLLVNDTPLFVRGVNWIPDDCFPSRITAERYAARLDEAAAAGCNLVRIWGGGIYESEDLYRHCDETGMLVWQDFLFACAAYSEEEPLRSEVVAEAREAVTRLSAHASLVLWNGCNENIWGHADWDWQDAIGDRTWGWGYYTQILPAIVAELDPTRPYSPGSPFSFAEGTHPNDPDHGTMHIWDVWNERDYSVYRDYTPRFVAEFGFQGPPTWTTLVSAVHDEPLRPDSAGMLVHQKAEDGNLKLDRGLSGHLPIPDRMEDWHWATSLNQARAVRFGIEHFRSWWPRCAGTVLWQLNDCWPVTSWAALDGAGRRKPLWYAMRHAYADRLLTLQPRGDGLALLAVNDSDKPWLETVSAERRHVDGRLMAGESVILEVAPRSVVTVPLPGRLTRPDDPTSEVLRVGAGVGAAWWHFVEDVEANLPAPQLDVQVVPEPGGHRVEVMARTLVRDLTLLVDRLDPSASVDEMLVTLLPGERVTFRVTGTVGVSPGSFLDPLVLRSSNDLFHPAAAMAGSVVG